MRILKSIDLGGMVLILLAGAIIYSLVGMFLGRMLDNRTIGSWYENPREYTTQYWVYLEPDKESTKNYRVRADIDKVNESDGEQSYSKYFLRQVYWNNGGITEFYDCELTNKSGDVCEDEEYKSYTIRLGEKFNEK